MKKKFTIILFFSMLHIFSYGQSNYQKALKEFFSVSGVEKSYEIVVNQMFEMYQQQKPDLPPNVWNDLKKELLKLSTDKLSEMLEPVYKKYLTLSDIEALTAFYKTPVGKKYVENMPQLMQESMEVGQKWGYELGTKFEEKLNEIQEQED